MKHPQSLRFVQFARRVALAAAVASSVLVGQALAAGPWLAGPSIAAVAEQVSFSGGGFVPSAVVQVSTQDPAGRQSAVALQVAADGTITAVLTPQVEGLHRIAIVDGSGSVLASAAVLSRP